MTSLKLESVAFFTDLREWFLDSALTQLIVAEKGKIVQKLLLIGIFQSLLTWFAARLTESPLLLS